MNSTPKVFRFWGAVDFIRWIYKIFLLVNFCVILLKLVNTAADNSLYTTVHTIFVSARCLNIILIRDAVTP